MEIGYVTSKGKLAIPQKLIRKYRIKPGTKLICRDEGSGIKIIPAVTKEEVYSNIGFMKTEKNLLKALMDEKKKESELWKKYILDTNSLLRMLKKFREVPL